MPAVTNPDQWDDGPDDDIIIWVGIIVLVAIISILIFK